MFVRAMTSPLNLQIRICCGAEAFRRVRRANLPGLGSAALFEVGKPPSMAFALRLSKGRKTWGSESLRLLVSLLLLACSVVV